MSAQSISADAVRTAALNHSDEMGCYSFVLPIPNTTPPLFVAFGDLESCLALLECHKDMAANEGAES